MSLSSLRPRPAQRFPFGGSTAVRTAAALDVTLAAETPEVELLDPVAAARHRTAWLDLLARSLEPNPFLDPDFILSAAQHLGLRRRPTILFVWDRGAAPRLLGVHALARSGLRRRGLARAWTHELVPCGVPLLDRERAREAAAALLGWSRAAGAAGLLFSTVPAGGPALAALASAAHESGRPLVTVAAWRRAVLRHPVGSPAGRMALSSKGAKEARRQRRRLADRGTLGFVSARAEDDLRDALERFLALEARGWKGAAGTALLVAPGRTAFTRVMTRLLASRARCRIDALTLDGEPIAMGIVLTQGDADFLWKIAFDERVSRFSPGVQFALELTERQIEEGRAAVTDSCAIPDHPMIDRIWRDRLDVADVTIGTGSGFRGALVRLRLLHHLRTLAKRIRAAW